MMPTAEVGTHMHIFRCSVCEVVTVRTCVNPLFKSEEQRGSEALATPHTHTHTTLITSTSLVTLSLTLCQLTQVDRCSL